MRKTTDVENLLTAMEPNGIERQEAQGQQEFCRSSELPKQMLHGCTREKLEEMGIEFGDDLDELFVKVRLPTGWQVKPTHHSMWNELVDEKGTKRAAIFYKAAFYDRKSHISLDQ